MANHEIRMVVLSTDDLESSIQFYTRTMGLSLKFRDGAHYAALDGGSITIALATEADHPMPGNVVLGVRTADVDASAAAIVASGGAILREPHDGTHERRAVAIDGGGNGLVLYQPLRR